MKREELVLRTADYVKALLSSDTSGHDWWHVYRVWNISKYLAKEENADIFTTQLTALLHDIDDFKLSNEADTKNLTKTRKWLEKSKLNQKFIEQICNIIKEVSFKGANEKSAPSSIEGQVVQDADRLDALGAIGVARAFAYGAHKKRPLYDPQGKVKDYKNFEEYKKGAESTLHHFYEKLLILKDRMNTKTAKQLAQSRHEFIERFLDQFLKEWEVNDVPPSNT